MLRAPRALGGGGQSLSKQKHRRNSRDDQRGTSDLGPAHPFAKHQQRGQEGEQQFHLAKRANERSALNVIAVNQLAEAALLPLPPNLLLLFRFRRSLLTIKYPYKQ